MVVGQQDSSASPDAYAAASISGRACGTILLGVAGDELCRIGNTLPCLADFNLPPLLW